MKAPKHKIDLATVEQLELLPGQILFQDLPEAPIEERVQKLRETVGRSIIIAGRGSARNPKRNVSEPSVWYVRRVGPNVESCKEGDWVMLSWRAVNDQDGDPACVSTFHIEEGRYAVGVDKGRDGTIQTGSVAAIIHNDYYKPELVS